MQDQIIDLQRRLAAAEARIAELERRERVMHPPGPAVVGPVLPFPKYEWSTLEPPLKPPYTRDLLTPLRAAGAMFRAPDSRG